MSKALFRFLRGEINGFYLTNIYDSLNVLTEEDKIFLAKFNNMVFKSENDITGNEFPMPYDMIRGIGIIAGIYPLRITTDSYNGTIRMTTSKVVDGEEYSERGLFNVATEQFDFVRTDQEEYDTDINTEADDEHRTSMNAPTDSVLGYLEEGVKNIKDDGTVDLTKVLSVPPQDKAYSEFYGVDHLFLSESENVQIDIDGELYFNLIKALQWIRYNGDSIMSLCKVINILCPDFIHIDSIDWSTGTYGIVYYEVSSAEIINKQAKIEAMKFLIRMKFPQLVLVEQE